MKNSSSPMPSPARSSRLELTAHEMAEGMAARDPEAAKAEAPAFIECSPLAGGRKPLRWLAWKGRESCEDGAVERRRGAVEERNAGDGKAGGWAFCIVLRGGQPARHPCWGATNCRPDLRICHSRSHMGYSGGAGRKIREVSKWRSVFPCDAMTIFTRAPAQPLRRRRACELQQPALR